MWARAGPRWSTSSMPPGLGYVPGRVGLCRCPLLARSQPVSDLHYWVLAWQVVLTAKSAPRQCRRSCRCVARLCEELAPAGRHQVAEARLQGETPKEYLNRALPMIQEASCGQRKIEMPEVLSAHTFLEYMRDDVIIIYIIRRDDEHDTYTSMIANL